MLDQGPGDNDRPSGRHRQQDRSLLLKVDKVDHRSYYRITEDDDQVEHAPPGLTDLPHHHPGGRRPEEEAKGGNPEGDDPRRPQLRPEGLLFPDLLLSAGCRKKLYPDDGVVHLTSHLHGGGRPDLDDGPDLDGPDLRPGPPPLFKFFQGNEDEDDDDDDDFDDLSLEFGVESSDDWDLVIAGGLGLANSSSMPSSAAGDVTDHRRPQKKDLVIRSQPALSSSSSSWSGGGGAASRPEDRGYRCHGSSGRGRGRRPPNRLLIQHLEGRDGPDTTTLLLDSCASGKCCAIQ